MTARLLCLAAALIAPGLLSAQGIKTQPDLARNVVFSDTIVREISLADLGFRGGITFRQLSGKRLVYVPIPAGVPLREGVLALDLRYGSTVPSDRYLQVSIAGQPVVSQALKGTTGEMRLPIPLRPDHVSNGFLTLELSYSGAASDRECIENRGSGDFLQVAASSVFSLAFDPSHIDNAFDFAALRPPEVRIDLSGTDELAGLAAAVRAAVLYGAENGGLMFGKEAQTGAGRDRSSTLWSEGRIEIETAASGPASEMRVTAGNGQPVLRLRGTDPQVGLWQLASGWSGLATGKPTVTDLAAPGQTATGVLPLTALSGDMAPRQLVDLDEYVIPFQSSDLPPGKTATAVSLMLAAGLDPEGRGISASVFLNDTFLGSRALASGDPEPLRFDLPEGLIRRDNVLRVLTQRQASGGGCQSSPQGYPVQLLPGSAITLSDERGGSDDFYGLRRDFGGGVQVVVDPDLGLSVEEAMSWLGGVAGSMIPERSPILARASVEDIDATLPFFVMSDRHPGDGDPAITFDKGRIELRDNQGTPVFAGEGLARLGVAQIVSRGGMTGLWLRPGDGPPPAVSPDRPLILDRGDLALIGEEGIIVATSMDQDALLEVRYPDTTSLAQLLDEYRLWLVGGLWLLMTLVVLMIFQRLYRRGNKPRET